MACAKRRIPRAKVDSVLNIWILTNLTAVPSLLMKFPFFWLGHSGPVRSVYVQDSEHCFLSASKDKTVKLWSLSNHGDGTAQSASSWTYYRHTRQVFHVGMVESVRQAVSCDGSLHVSYFGFIQPASKLSYLGEWSESRENARASGEAARGRHSLCLPK